MLTDGEHTATSVVAVQLHSCASGQTCDAFAHVMIMTCKEM